MVSPSEANRLAKKENIPYIECSVSTGKNVEGVLKLMAECIMSRPEETDDQVDDFGSPYLKYRLNRF